MEEKKEEKEEQKVSSPNGGGGSSGGDIDQNKALAIIGYLGILFLVPMLAAPKSKFAQYHARQGMVLFIAEVILWAAVWVLALVTIGIGAVLFPIVSIVALVWTVLGIINAANGTMKPLPVIGNFIKS